MTELDPNQVFVEQVYAKDKKLFLSGLAIVAADAFPALEAWRTPPTGTIDVLSRVATAGAFLYGLGRTTIGGMKTLQQLSLKQNENSTKPETDPTEETSRSLV